MRFRELASAVAKQEGKKNAVGIGNIREVLSILVKMEKSTSGEVSACVQRQAALKKK